MYWTLVDNFEWAFAYELKFGLYEFNPEWGDPAKRRLKDGSKVGCSTCFVVRMLVLSTSDILSKQEMDSYGYACTLANFVAVPEVKVV